MCTGLEAAAIIGATASTVATMGNTAPKGPDPAEERAKAEAEATQRANAKISLQRKAMRENSLLTGAGVMGGGGAAAPAATPRRATLGV